MANLFETNPVWTLLQRAKTLDEGKIFQEVFLQKDVQKLVLDLNKTQLKEKGINSEGVSLSSIGGDYSPVTIEISKFKGRPKKSPTLIDLHDTGQFYNTFKITSVTRNAADIDANPVKDDTNLFDEWGEEILGLTFESIEKLVSYITILYQQKILRNLGL